MRKSIPLLILLTLLAILLAACGNNTATPLNEEAPFPFEFITENPPSPTAPLPTAVPPPYIGTWISSDGTVVILTDSVLYIREVEDTYARETYYDIKGTDWEKRVLQVRISKILINGEGVGFSTPNYNFLYEVNGDQLRLARSLEETDIPTAVDELVYVRKP